MNDDTYREMRVREISREFDKVIATHQESAKNKRRHIRRVGMLIIAILCTAMGVCLLIGGCL